MSATACIYDHFCTKPWPDVIETVTHHLHDQKVFVTGERELAYWWVWSKWTWYSTNLTQKHALFQRGNHMWSISQKPCCNRHMNSYELIAHSRLVLCVPDLACSCVFCLRGDTSILHLWKMADDLFASKSQNLQKALASLFAAALWGHHRI